MTTAPNLPSVIAILGNCTRCPLHETRKHIVFGDGSEDAKVMFVGEAPGADEDEQGLPFVGRAGQLLTQWIEHVGLKREDVYIANIIKCRPPNNRDPESEEIAMCTRFLDAQVDAIKPKVIIALGRFAANYLAGRKGASMAVLRQDRLYYDSESKIPVIATYHPSYVLRKDGGFDPEKSENYKAIFDLKKAMRIIQ